MRVPAKSGEWIDRSAPIEFKFEGRTYTGYAGDTVGSALWGADVRVLGRSFKYHRPRGVLSLANHDTNALHQWGDQPNLRADVVPLQAGMDLTAVNTLAASMATRAACLAASPASCRSVSTTRLSTPSVCSRCGSACSAR